MKRSAVCILAVPAFTLVLLASSLSNDIVDAARSRNAPAVTELIERSADVNAAAPDGSTALHWAVHHDDVAMTKALLDAGADASAANRYGVSPLMPAATNGNAEIVKLLLRAGADANAATPEGETVLMTAARTGKPGPVKALIAHGADVNAKESWRGQTALMWAAGEGHLEAVKLLVAAGADIHARSGAGFSPFLFAVRQGRKDVAAHLLQAGADVNEALPARRRRGWGAEGSDSDEPKVGASALEVAVSNAHFELAVSLLEAGADPNASGPGWTPLHTATWVRKPGVGSNDPAPEGSGNVDSLEMVRKLVEHGADINVRISVRSTPGKHSLNTVGATPFLAAARTADAELMRLLAELGADPLLPNENGTTPLMVAAGVGTRAPDEDAGTPDAVVEAVKVALELGGDPNAVDQRGDTAMHGAAYKHVPGAVPVLVEAGAKIEIWNRKNHLGWTPLRIATGVHRGMNLRASPETAAAIRKVHEAAGVSTLVEPEEFISGATR